MGYQEGAMPRRIDMFELREVLRRLRDGEAVKLIHRQTGRHKTVIRTLKKIAEANGWLEAGEPLPDESLIAESYRARRTGRKQEAHSLEALNEELERWLKEEKSFLVIHQLVSERGIDCSESTVRRYLRRRFAKPPRLVIPREHALGEVMEVDFGYLCLARERRTGAVKKCLVFSARLCASRKAFRVLVTDQRAATFFRCHMLAFEAWGGTPRTVRPDNLKAAVIKASFQEPLVNRSYRQLAEHYGFTISACLPYHPRHKGGVENDIKYVKRNFLPLAVEHARQRGHEPAYLDELEAELASWSAATDERVVRGVGSTVNELFAEEQPSLQPLAHERWEPVAWKQAKVGPDYRIQFDCGYYSAPWPASGCWWRPPAAPCACSSRTRRSPATTGSLRNGIAGSTPPMSRSRQPNTCATARRACANGPTSLVRPSGRLPTPSWPTAPSTAFVRCGPCSEWPNATHPSGSRPPATGPCVSTR
jgi:transposase